MKEEEEEEKEGESTGLLNKTYFLKLLKKNCQVRYPAKKNTMRTTNEDAFKLIRNQSIRTKIKYPVTSVPNILDITKRGT